MKFVYFFITVLLIFNCSIYGIVKSASEPDYDPFCIVTDSGTATGFSVELLTQTLKIMGEDVSIPVGEWKKIKNDLVIGNIDVLPLVGKTPEREKIFDFTFPYMSMYGTIVVRDDNRDIKSLNDLNGKKIIVLEGDNAHEFLVREKITDKIVLEKSFKDALKKLSEGQNDAVLIQRLLAQKIIISEKIENLKFVAYPLKSFRQDFCFAVKKGNNELLAILNEGLALIKTNGQFDKCYQRWFGDIEKHSLLQKEIIVGGDSYCPPMEFYNSEGVVDGYNVELTKELAKVTGLNFKIELGKWGDVRKKLTNGEIDVIHSMYYSHERDKIFDFSKSHSVYEHVVFINSKSKNPKKIQDLFGRIAVVMDGDIMHDKLKGEYGFDSLIVLPSEKDALIEVNRTSGTFAVTTKLTGMYWQKKLGLKNIKMTNLVFHYSDPCYAVLPENRELLRTINIGLQALKETGKISELQKKWFLKYKNSKNDKNIKISVALILILFSILIIVLIINKRLKVEVDKRVQKIRELTKFTDEDPNPIFKVSLNGRIIFANEAANPILDYWNTSINDFVPDEWGEKIEESYNKNLDLWDELIIKDKIYSLIFKPALNQSSVNIYGLDVTNQKNTEEHLRQVEKMQVVGSLAGGIAHDFNNQLAIILGNAEVLLDDYANSPMATKLLSNIIKVSKRAGELTSQLLAFARKGNYIKTEIDIHNIASEIINMLEHTVDKKINLYKKLSASEHFIKGDPPQVYSAIMNIAINARDAMDSGGDLSIETENMQIDKKKVLNNGDIINKGKYILIKIIDTGTGIDDDNLQKIFEPFFTTKELGKGTGMGLSAVQGIVKIHNGFVDVKTEIGKGTEFLIYFPIVEKLNVNEDELDKIEENKKFSGTALLVDDEPLILEFATVIIEAMGFNILSASNGKEALHLLENNKDDIKLVILDVIMPVLRGDEIYEQIKTLNPNIKIIVASGYSEDNVNDLQIIKLCDGYLRKPYTKDNLKELVTKIFNA